ncbi:MAG TPA: response regulator [Chitinophagaceae bacterium]|nr:response regulator [Chitinophagaceae bacterium]
MNKKTLLLAEDDEDDRMLFSDFLQDRNDFELLHSCENGMEVIEYLNAIQDADKLPSLVVLDQNMPKMNGSQTLQLLKNSPRYSKIPVAVYTTYTDKRLIDECYQSGALTVVAKPISPSGYHQMMDELVRLIPN